MECAICYEKFSTPKTQDVRKFDDLLITYKHNTTYYCPVPSCECIICRGCCIKITRNGKSIDEMMEDNMSSIYDYFNVLFVIDGSIIKGLGVKEFYKRCFPEFDT